MLTCATWLDVQLDKNKKSFISASKLPSKDYKGPNALLYNSSTSTYYLNSPYFPRRACKKKIVRQRIKPSKTQAVTDMPNLGFSHQSLPSISEGVDSEAYEVKM